MRRWLSTAATVTAICVAVPATAVADPSVRLIPPPTTGPYHRTADPQPVFGVEADGADAGEGLQCHIVSVEHGDSLLPCGPPLPGCTAQLCGSFRPDGPLGDDQYYLAAGPGPPDGLVDFSATATFDFVVDTTPPPAPELDGPVDGTSLLPMPFRPHFDYAAGDDDPVPYTATDELQCSLTALGEPAAWQACPASASERIPRRRRDYRFQVRAVDDFGRVGSPAAVEFNPVPCAVRARRTSIHRLVRRGLSVSVRCAYVRAATVTVFYRRHGYIARKTLRGHGRTHWRARARVRLYRVSAHAVRRLRRLPLQVVAAPVPGHREDVAYGKPGTARLTLR